MYRNSLDNRSIKGYFCNIVHGIFGEKCTCIPKIVNRIARQNNGRPYENMLTNMGHFWHLDVSGTYGNFRCT